MVFRLLPLVEKKHFESDCRFTKSTYIFFYTLWEIPLRPESRKGYFVKFHMFFLILQILFSSSFGLIVKHSQASGRNLLVVGAINYTVAAFAAAISVIYKGDFEFSDATCVIGILGGIAYVVSFFFLMNVIRLTGISITWAIIRLSVLVPVLFSIFYWHEMPNSYQIAGISFVCLSLPLLSINSNADTHSSMFNKTSLLIIILFIVTGGCGLAAKAFSEFTTGDQRQMYLLFLFGTAAIISVSALFVQKSPPKVRDIPFGIILGLCNICGNYCLLLALMKLPGMVVFPISSSMGVVLTTLAGMAVWHERLRKLAIAGIVSAIIAVVLINL